MSHKVLSKAPDTHSGSHVSHTGLGSMMTTGDVLGYLRVGPRTVYRLIQSEALPALASGGNGASGASTWTTGSNATVAFGQ